MSRGATYHRSLHDQNVGFLMPRRFYISALSKGESRPSMRQHTMWWKTSRTCLSSGRSPSFMVVHTVASSAAAFRTVASLSLVIGTGDESIA